mmetsp:Transcript_2583/g.6045  ORF Transcript_2583/g.6045 Transcript_2583/m.6045 type:complete len:288 (+) Transcript_2583:43-906(+)
MVILHVKRTEAKNEFLYETTTAMEVGALLAELTEVHNMRLKVLRLAQYLKDLATHGPIRPEETRGLTDETAKISELDINAYGKPTNPDPHGYRTGCPPPPETAAVLTRMADEAESGAKSTICMPRKTFMTKDHLQVLLDNMRGAVMIAYPAYHRLPQYDPVRVELEDQEELDGRSDLQDVLEPDCQMWWAGKQVMREKLLSEYVGRNEKTKIVCRLTSANAGAPVREPRIDEDTHKAMLSHYYKKQEENKKLMEDNDDSYLESSWANPKALKSALVGGGKDISWKPF